MREVPLLGKQELIALIRELAKVAGVKRGLRKHLRAVLAEADRQERTRKKKALVAKKRREKRARERRKAWAQEELGSKRERARWAREQEEIRKMQEKRHAAWILAHGDSNIETIFGIPVRLESREEAAECKTPLL